MQASMSSASNGFARSVIGAALAEGRGSGGDDGLRRPLIARGAITLTFDPIDISWNGIRVALSPLEAHVFALVARRGRVSWDDVDQALIACGAKPGSREVLIFRIRRKFLDIGAADPLQTVRGWGLKFRVEPSITGSRTIWIGRSEPMDGSGVPR